MDEVTSEEAFDINAANKTFINSVLKLSTKLTSDVTRSLFAKSYSNARVVSLGSEIPASLPSSIPQVCSRCYTPQRAGVLHTQLLGCYRNARSVRHLTAKKRSVLHKLSTRERMMIDSHNQWSNILLIRCRVCGLKTRQLCPLPGPRPAPSSSRQTAKKPDVLQLMVATMTAVTPSRKKKKNKNKKCEGGLVISEDLKQEIQMTMRVHESNSTKKKRKSSPLAVDSKSDACASPCLNSATREVIELDCVEPRNIVSSDDSMLKCSQGTPKSEFKGSTPLKKIVTSKVLSNNSNKCKPIVTPQANNTPKSKPAANIEQKCLKRTTSAGSTKLMSKSSPASKQLVCDVMTPPASKKVKNDKVSIIDQDNIAQYGVPLLRINEVKKTQSERKMQQKSNALKSAFKQSMPPKSSKSIKDFLNTLF